MVKKVFFLEANNSGSFCLTLLTCLVFELFFPLRVAGQDAQRHSFEHPQMGTLFRIVMYTPDTVTARTASDSAFQRIDSLNNKLSDYLESSELNRLSVASGDGTFIRVSKELYQVIYEAQSLSEQTDGAFDITIGPYVRLWRIMNRRYNPQLPDKSILNKAGQFVGYQKVSIDSLEKKVALNQPDMQLDLGGIAKGYAADEALEVLQSYGIQSALIDAGGDITVGEAPPDKDGWHISIPYPTSDDKVDYITLVLANQAVATSGDLFQFIEIDGERYSHIINPKTGLGITDQSTVTVVAPNGITADGHASALSVMGPSKGIRFAESKSEIFARFVFKKKNKIIVQESLGFKKLIQYPENDSQGNK